MIINFKKKKSLDKNVIIILLDQFRKDFLDVHPIFDDLIKKSFFLKNCISYAPYTLASCHATLSGTYEISGFYNSIDTDGLNTKMLSIGLGYYLNKLRFGLNYETLLDYSGDDVDFLNGLSNNTFEMSGSATTFSIGTFKVFKMTNFDCIPILDLMTVKSKLTMSYINPGNGIEYTDENDGSANLLRFGAAFKMNDFVIQPIVTMNEDRDKRYSISVIFKL